MPSTELVVAPRCSMIEVFPSMGADEGPETQEVECQNQAAFIDQTGHAVCADCYAKMAHDPDLTDGLVAIAAAKKTP